MANYVEASGFLHVKRKPSAGALNKLNALEYLRLTDYNDRTKGYTVIYDCDKFYEDSIICDMKLIVTAIGAKQIAEFNMSFFDGAGGATNYEFNGTDIVEYFGETIFESDYPLCNAKDCLYRNDKGRCHIRTKNACLNDDKKDIVLDKTCAFVTKCRFKRTDLPHNYVFNANKSTP